jgi:deoxynucleotide monophosphate kinase-like protein
MLIAFTGLKNSGKDTAADYLVESYGFKKIGFADKLKDSLCGVLSITRNQLEELKNNPDAHVIVTKGKDVYGIDQVIRDLSMRQMLQRYGTEGHRDIFWKDFWVDALLPLPEMDNPFTDIKLVISDCRFANEALRVRELGGKVIRVNRNLVDIKVDTHASEIGFDPSLIDFYIDNDDSISMLYNRLDTLMETLLAEAGSKII